MPSSNSGYFNFHVLERLHGKYNYLVANVPYLLGSALLPMARRQERRHYLCDELKGATHLLTLDLLFSIVGACIRIQ